MALLVQNPGLMPAGQFDLKDTVTGLKGGEVMVLDLASRTLTAAELAAADVLDGYDYGTPGQRAVARLATTGDANKLPLCLADDGSAPDYLTMFGQVVGATAGLATAGAVLGPHTTTGSGKVTLWDKPGFYVVTVDAVNAAMTSAALTPGTTLGFDTAGKLAKMADAVANSGVASFVEFEGGRKSGSLVTTPARLVGAADTFDRLKVFFHGGMGPRT